MRKLIALFLALALCLGAASALADRTITVSGTGEILVAADTAVVSVGVNCRDKDALKAQSRANEMIAAIRAALTAALETFGRRFFVQQFKRNCSPEAPQISEISLAARGGWEMPSLIDPAFWRK